MIFGSGHLSTTVQGDGASRQAAGNVVAANRYGHFTADGREYVIADPRTPRPWCNVISNPRMGLVVSQTGSGFSWIDNSQLGVITRWEQDLARDASGKFLLVRDADSGACWSLSPAPLWNDATTYECRHGIGYSTIVSERAGIRATWTLFVHADQTVELWRLRLENLTALPRKLELTALLEWCCGVAPSPRREFHKLFLETDYDATRNAIFARNHMWEFPSERFGHWNTDFPYVSAFASTEPIQAAEGDKAAFIGQYRSLANPVGLEQSVWAGRFGRHHDPIAALRSVIRLGPGETRELGFALAVESSRAACEALLDQTLLAGETNAALEAVQESWRARLATQRVETPDKTVNFLCNDWLRYQAISARIWGRCGYYQQSGAYGFRDQLQDSQVWLLSEPERCRKQIEMHAAHQFADGSVYHWWHPLSEQGLRTTMTDDLLWLAFVTANYIRETGDTAVLAQTAPFVDDDTPRPIADHIVRAFDRVFRRTSARGLPLIGAGDWNDGLSACGLQEKGESIWLGHFLAGLLRDWSTLLSRVAGTSEASALPRDAGELAADFARRDAALRAALNTHGWDGEWYLRATLDDGSKLGSASNRVGRIFLNAQTWAVLNDVGDAARCAQVMQAVRKHLVSEAGALLLAPAFDTPREEIGYITRYAPGLRENGGVYSHAATWAIAAACKAGDAELVETLLEAINPANKDPDQYWAEPYVTPGNVDGPDSPHHGRGGWTWYTGSATWLHRVICEWVLGVRPEWDGLRIAPCLPKCWKQAGMTRPYRGCTYRIQIQRVAGGSPGGPRVTVDGNELAENLIPAPTESGRTFDVSVRY